MAVELAQAAESSPELEPEIVPVSTEPFLASSGVVCSECDTLNPVNHLFCLGCGRLLQAEAERVSRLPPVEPARAEVALREEPESEAPPVAAPTKVECAECGWLNAAEYAFCVECGIALRTEPETEAPPVAAPADMRCANCGWLNAAEYAFCVECGIALRTEPETEAPPVAAPTEARCGNCGWLNAAEYAFCIECGNAMGNAPKPIAESIPAPQMSNRLKLRLTLLLSASVLASLALAVYFVVNVQWAIAPAVVALLSLWLALGSMSNRSFALFKSDMRRIFIGE